MARQEHLDADRWVDEGGSLRSEQAVRAEPRLADPAAH
jgi:hypothetical protein